MLLHCPQLFHLSKSPPIASFSAPLLHSSDDVLAFGTTLITLPPNTARRVRVEHKFCHLKPELSGYLWWEIWTFPLACKWQNFQNHCWSKMLSFPQQKKIYSSSKVEKTSLPSPSNSSVFFFFILISNTSLPSPRLSDRRLGGAIGRCARYGWFA